MGLEVRGRDYRLACDQGRVVVLPAFGEGPPIIDVAVSELVHVNLIRLDETTIAAEIVFADPNVVVPRPDGDPMTLKRNPYLVLLDFDALDETVALLTEVRRAIVAARRVRVPAPDLTRPAPVPGPNGPQRPDVVAAASRMRANRPTGRALDAMHGYARPDETVLEMVGCEHTGKLGLFVLTTQRMLFIHDSRRPFTFECPLAEVRSVTVEAAEGRHSQALKVDNFFMDRYFEDGHHEDNTRFAAAAAMAIDLMHRDGTIAPVRPGPLELFAEWSVLTERMNLGMIDEEQFRFEGRGILESSPGWSTT